LGGVRIATRELGTEEIKPILKVEFNVERTLKKEPNTADVVIYNLSKDSRAAVQEKGIETTIEAGYVGTSSQIFAGQLEFGSSIREGTDWVTTLQTADGSNNFRSQRINVSFKGGVSAGEVLQAAAEALGLDLGNIRDKANRGTIRGKLEKFAKGNVLSGKASVELDKIVKAFGLEWSIQDGELQLLEPNETIDQDFILLSPGTGLVGSPEPGEDGVVNATSLLQPNLIPGKGVDLQSREIDGFFRVQKANWTGDTWGSDWFTELELKPL
jgi:hypothetical protein